MKFKEWKKYPTNIQLDRFADAFYDEDYDAMSQMLGKRVKNQRQAEIAFEVKKDKLRKII